MRSLIEADDLEPGVLLTVYTGPSLTTIAPTPFGFEKIRTEDRRLCGLPFKVVAISLPYVVAEAQFGAKHRVHLDVREISLSRITQEYVDAMQCPGCAQHPPN